MGLDNGAATMPLGKKALVAGINHYQEFQSLAACVADAEEMAEALRRHSDGAPNYDCITMLGEANNGGVSRRQLRRAINELLDPAFTGEVLFYFSGHGVITGAGGYLATSDAAVDDFGIPMQEIVDLANNSRAKDVLLVLDCCHSGAVGNAVIAGANPFASLREGITVLAASRDRQAAVEAGGHGLFTAAVLEALDGGAADHMGWVTAPSIYAYVERRFSPWDNQSPVYKTHTTSLTVVRECAPLIDRLDLRQLIIHFPKPDAKMQLDPEFEPEDEHGNLPQSVNSAKMELAALLKRYRDAGLLKPTVASEQLFWTARRGHTVELTARGREYWSLVQKGRV